MKDQVRATLLGVVSRGAGCAEFNSPAVYGSVSKAFDWIKETIAKEMPKKDQACPADKNPAKKGSDYQDLPPIANRGLDDEEFKHYLMETYI